MSMTMKHKRNEQGMVAIMIAIFLMIILSLMTLGFARLMQREQRQALDNSLTTQAYYAAESGINDAVKAARIDPNYAKTSCAPDAVLKASVASISGPLQSSYPCVLVDQNPSTLEYNNGSIRTDRSTVVPVQSLGAAFNKVKIAWSSTSAAPTFANCATTPLPSASTWTTTNGTTTGLLRVDLVPADGTLTRDNLINNSLNLYLYPCASGSGGVKTISYAGNAGPNQQGQIIKVDCGNDAAHTPRNCVLDIDVSTAPQNIFYLRMKSVYAPSNVTISGFDAANNQLNLSGAQVKVDSTGKVNDVVRRLQVRVPIKQYPIPEYVVQSMDGICKRLDVLPAPGNTTGFGAAQTCTP